MTSTSPDQLARIAAARDSTACRFEDVDEAWRFEDQVLDIDGPIVGEDEDHGDTVWWIVLGVVGGGALLWPVWCVVTRGL